MLSKCNLCYIVGIEGLYKCGKLRKYPNFSYKKFQTLLKTFDTALYIRIVANSFVSIYAPIKT